MTKKPRPETIEGQWDILYRDYPDVYDEWSAIKGKPDHGGVVNKHFPLKNCVIADVGSGTGSSTFDLARYARQVIGIEPEDNMRARAEMAAVDRGVANVCFLKGTAEHMPLEDASVDCVVAVAPASFHCEENVTQFCREAERIARPGGFIATFNVAPGAYGGELAHIIAGVPKEELPTENARDRVFARLGFQYVDFFGEVDYGTVEKAVSTYGFIYGKRAIEYIRKHGITVIREKGRMHFKHLPQAQRPR